MEIKRATELTICSLLKEVLPDLLFVPAKGGGDDVTPIWQPAHYYQVGDVLRPSALTMVHVIAVTRAGDSGSTEPAFTDVIGSTYIGPPDYETTGLTVISQQIDSANVLPPFCAIMCEPSEKTLAQEDTDILHGTAAWITRLGQTNVVEHSQNFKRIYDALTRIGSGYDILRRITIHGLDVSTSSEFSDTARDAHGDVVEFIVGVTAKPG